MPILDVVDLHKHYPSGGDIIRALNGVSLTVEEGEFVTLMGASGSGKSTLLHLIAGLDAPTSGTIEVGGKPIAQMSDRQRTLFRRKHIGIVFQAYNLLPALTALENVTLPAVIDGAAKSDSQRRGRELLELLKLQQREHHRPQTLSGGEQQRVAIARALMNDPLLLLADEPTGNLDTQHSRDVWRQIAALAREHGKTIVAVTHEPTGATFADRVIVLRDGQVVGQLKPGGEGHASAVAARYTELVG